VVEISQKGEKNVLENYGQVDASSVYQGPFQSQGGGKFMLSSPDVSKVIRSILKEAHFRTKEAVFTIPDFSTFFTTFKLPQMTKEEVPKAVEFEARRHIPLPVSEVILDWFLIGGELGRKGTGLNILLVAVTKEVVNRYQEIAKSSRLNLKCLEAEAFSLARALAKDLKYPVCLIDIGAQSTTVNVVDNGILKLSYSSDASGNNLTYAIVRSLSVNHEKAEFLKKERGLESKEIKQVLLPLINLIIMEIEKILKDFKKTDKKEVQKIIIAGGSALLPGLTQYISSCLKKETTIANPFSNFYYPPVLEKKIRKMGPSLSTAVGAALRNLV